MLTMYTRPTCTKCKTAKTLLRVLDIDYKEEDAMNVLEDLLTLGYTSLPVYKYKNKYYKTFEEIGRDRDN